MGYGETLQNRECRGAVAFAAQQWFAKHHRQKIRFQGGVPSKSER
jgi:hypothetical protein